MPQTARLFASLFLGLLVLSFAPARAAEPVPPPAPEGWLGLPAVDRGGRAPFNPNVVFERYLWKADAAPPKAGETVRGSLGREASWRALQPNEKGEVPGQGLAFAYATIESDKDQVRMMAVVGASSVYVNGQPVGGDGYRHKITQLPVELYKGTNHLFAAGFRGTFRVAFDYTRKPVLFASWDATKPELVPGERIGDTAGVVLVNNSDRELNDVDVSGVLYVTREGMEGLRFELAAPEPVSIPPLGTLKVCLQGDTGATPWQVGEGFLAVVAKRGGKLLDQTALKLDVRKPGEAYRTTFQSDIDGSAQFFALRKPAVPPSAPLLPVLTLHGAGVDAYDQAKAYSARPGGWIVAPTNRRPFGFDWQDWGRQDAYEVMDHLARHYGLPERFHLTGHSMGGHGAWHLAVNDPDRFLSVAPSAGWSSFDTYGGARPQGALVRVWHAADAASNTDLLLSNLRDTPIYVLHGTKDDNVPPREAKQIVKQLEGVAKDLQVHYAEGKGHWWDGDAAPGADCVDWPGIFAMFRKHASRKAPAELDWRSADLSVDAEHYWLRVEQPLLYGSPTAVRVRVDAQTNGMVVETENVRRWVGGLPLVLQVRAGHSLSIDGQDLPGTKDKDTSCQRIAFERIDGNWYFASEEPRPSDKRPERMGPFKRAFDNRFVMVYGTAGTIAEDAALLASARYDAEQWRYRANGRAECVTDRFFLAKAERYRDRNVILYGNATTNGAWDAVVPETCPIRPERGKVKGGLKTWEGDSYGILLVHPRKGSDVAQVAAIADTGVPGTRLNFRVPYFLSGVGIPDFVVYGPEVLQRGDEGVRAAGFFDSAWALAE